MHELYNLLRLAHIAAGMIALFMAPGAMLTVKGGLWHRRWGKIYFWAMAVVAASALAMTLLKPNVFLLMTVLFAFYLAFRGYRALYHKRPGDGATVLDWSGLAVVGVGSVGLLAWAVSLLRQGTSFGWVGIVFGLIGGYHALIDGNDFLRPSGDKRAWFYKHMTSMLAAYIATVSAFSAVNFSFLPPLVRWLWPTVLGGIGITLWVAHYKRGNRASLQPETLSMTQ